MFGLAGGGHEYAARIGWYARGATSGRIRHERFDRRVDQTECSTKRTTPIVCIQEEIQIFIEMTDTMDQLRVLGTRPDLPAVPTIGVRPDLGIA